MMNIQPLLTEEERALATEIIDRKPVAMTLSEASSDLSPAACKPSEAAEPATPTEEKLEIQGSASSSPVRHKHQAKAPFDGSSVGLAGGLTKATGRAITNWANAAVDPNEFFPQIERIDEEHPEMSNALVLPNEEPASMSLQPEETVSGEVKILEPDGSVEPADWQAGLLEHLTREGVLDMIVTGVKQKVDMHAAERPIRADDEILAIPAECSLRDLDKKAEARKGRADADDIRRAAEELLEALDDEVTVEPCRQGDSWCLFLHFYTNHEHQT
ncbi:unnamed protein product [Protopolystoma xenopodis]|uniref:Uncharacterized protein n=1 Tax=Protopolystoma xenopodis TaxID=117903 RepID=A0A3S5BQQ6_9PLAT|nr:unnamed protein product [Protopolystoma xenopodis]